MSEDIRTILRAWGRERAIDMPPNGYPSSSAFARMMVNPGELADRSYNPRLGDDDATRVDAAVSSLRNRKPNHYRAIVCAYLYGMMDQQIAKKVCFLDFDSGAERTHSRSWVKTTRENAEHWIAGQLDI